MTCRGGAFGFAGTTDAQPMARFPRGTPELVQTAVIGGHRAAEALTPRAWMSVPGGC